MITSEISDNVTNSNHRSIMSKGTSIKDAIAKLEEREQCKASECEHVSLIAQLPPIEKMDASLSSLSKCVRLSMSTNAIEKIANLNGLKNLKILSLGRNNIKSLTGIEAVGDTLEELWISYNRIDKLKGVNVLKKLKVLFMSNNNIADSSEFVKLADLPCLEELVFIGNPLQQSMDDQEYVEFVKKKVPKLKILDGSALVREDD